MGTRSSKIVGTSGSKTKLARRAAKLDTGSESDLRARSDSSRPDGAQVSYQDKGRFAVHDPGIYASGRRAKAHGYYAAGGMRVIRTGSSDVVKPAFGPSLF